MFVWKFIHRVWFRHSCQMLDLKVCDQIIIPAQLSCRSQTLFSSPKQSARAKSGWQFGFYLQGCSMACCLQASLIWPLLGLVSKALKLHQPAPTFWYHTKGLEEVGRLATQTVCFLQHIKKESHFTKQAPFEGAVTRCVVESEVAYHWRKLEKLKKRVQVRVCDVRF